MIFVKAGVADGDLGGGVKADGHAEVLRLGVDRIELGLAQIQSLLHVGRHHDADGAFLGNGAADFFDGFSHDLRRDHGGVLDAIAALFAEIIRPVVVGFRQFDGEVEFAHKPMASALLG